MSGTEVSGEPVTVCVVLLPGRTYQSGLQKRTRWATVAWYCCSSELLCKREREPQVGWRGSHESEWARSRALFRNQLIEHKASCFKLREAKKTRKFHGLSCKRGTHQVFFIARARAFSLWHCWLSEMLAQQKWAPASRETVALSGLLILRPKQCCWWDEAGESMRWKGLTYCYHVEVRLQNGAGGGAQVVRHSSCLNLEDTESGGSRAVLVLGRRVCYRRWKAKLMSMMFLYISGFVVFPVIKENRFYDVKEEHNNLIMIYFNWTILISL